MFFLRPGRGSFGTYVKNTTWSHTSWRWIGTSLDVLQSILRPMMLLPGELQLSKANFITTEVFLNRNMRLLEEVMGKVDGYKPGGTIKGRQCLTSSTEGWPGESAVARSQAEPSEGWNASWGRILIRSQWFPGKVLQVTHFEHYKSVQSIAVLNQYHSVYVLPMRPNNVKLSIKYQALWLCFRPA